MKKVVRIMLQFKLYYAIMCSEFLNGDVVNADFYIMEKSFKLRAKGTDYMFRITFDDGYLAHVYYRNKEST